MDFNQLIQTKKLFPVQPQNLSGYIVSSQKYDASAPSKFKMID